MSATDTPMIVQYKALKAQAPDCLLFYRLGDFYELFFEDAHVASKACGLTLTSRNKNSEIVVPMCGVPFHSAGGYVTKLGAAGHKIAICEQMQDPATAKGLVERKIIRIITPGMPFDPLEVDGDQRCYVGACACVDDHIALACVDSTRGEFWYTLLSNWDDLFSLLVSLGVRECLFPTSLARDLNERTQELEKSGCVVEWCDDSFFAFSESETRLKTQFGVTHLDAHIHQTHKTPGVTVCGAVLKYLQLCEPESSFSHIHACHYFSLSQCMVLSPGVIQSLELLRAPHAQDRDRGLCAVIDGSKTPMGRRLLRKRLLSPLTDLDEINARQAMQSDFLVHHDTLLKLSAKLSEVGDLERLYGKICLGHANPREVWRLGRGMLTAVEILECFREIDSIAPYIQGDGPVKGLSQHILTTLVDEPPLTRRDGGIIRADVNRELEHARHAEQEFARWREDYEKQLQEQLHIPSLKIKHSRVFGYSIEVTKANLSKVPETFTRKQTMVGGERYVTPELKERENIYVVLKNKQIQIEEQIFAQLIEQIETRKHAVLEFLSCLAVVDMVVGQCKIIKRQGWCRPTLEHSKRCEITEGFHPVVSEMLEQEGRHFVRNDVVMEGEKEPLMLISGPNMGGKSTLMRQVALTYILAQSGFYVPAAAARLGIVDQVFTRIGAADAQTEGKSTFFMEMQETAQFLMHATDRSLIIVDELGRGTSTYDGLSIVWAVCEYLLTTLKARSFCATHFYELARLKDTYPQVGLFHVGADEADGRLVFNYRLREGFTSRSYGVHVAKLAGVRPEVVHRASEILKLFEGNKGIGKKSGYRDIVTPGANESASSHGQRDLF